MKKELSEIKKVIASCQEEIKKLQGQDQAQDPKFSLIENMVSNLIRYVYGVEEQLWRYQDEHAKGHTPKLLSPTHMEKFCKACGMDNDYNVQKKTIYSNAKKTLNIDL